MAGEYIRKDGVSGWVTVATGLSLTAGNFIQASTSDFVVLLAATEEDYPEFEARLDITSGTPTENNIVEVHLRMSDGTNQEPAPSGNFAPHHIGSITLDNQIGNYFEDGLSILSKKSTIYLKSNEPATTLTATLLIKAKTGTAA